MFPRYVLWQCHDVLLREVKPLLGALRRIECMEKSSASVRSPAGARHFRGHLTFFIASRTSSGWNSIHKPPFLPLNFARVVPDGSVKNTWARSRRQRSTKGSFESASTERHTNRRDSLETSSSFHIPRVVLCQSEFVFSSPRSDHT